MKIAVYGRPDEKDAQVLFAFIAGASAMEVQAVLRAPRADSYADFNAACMISNDDPRKDKVREEYQKRGLPVFILERSQIPGKEDTWQINLDELNWLPPIQCNEDRFKSFEVAIEDWPISHELNETMTKEEYVARMAYANWHIEEIAEGKFFPFYFDVISGDVNADGASSDA